MHKNSWIDILNRVPLESDNKKKGLENPYNKPELTYIKDGKVVTDSSYDSLYPYSNEYLGTVIQDNRRKSYQYLSQLMQNGLATAMVDTLSSEAVKSNIIIECKDDEDVGDLIKEIESRLYQLDIKTVMRQALRSNYIFGGCCIFFEIDKNTTNHLEIPFTISPLTLNEKKKLTCLTVVDPLYCVPIQINTINPLQSDFYYPSLYSVFGVSVDHSRLWRLVTNEAPTNLKPMYNFFGISMLQQAEEYIYRFEIITENINAIIKRMRTSVFSTSMSSILTGCGSDEELATTTQSLNTRVSMLHEGNNNSMILLDKELEDFREINTSLAGLSDILSSISEQLCIIPKIPATKLLGISPKGMNATGESDIQNFYDEIMKIQVNYLIPFLEHVVDILHMEITGTKNDHLRVYFEPLNKQAMVESQIEASYINDTLRAVEIGVITPNEARERLSEFGWNIESNDNDLELNEENFLNQEYSDEEYPTQAPEEEFIDGTDLSEYQDTIH